MDEEKIQVRTVRSLDKIPSKTWEAGVADIAQGSERRAQGRERRAQSAERRAESAEQCPEP